MQEYTQEQINQAGTYAANGRGAQNVIIIQVTNKEKRNHFLTCIGMSSKEREKLIRTETGIFFWIPAAVAVVMVPVLTGEIWNMREYTKADCVHYLRYLLIFAVIYLVVQGTGCHMVRK